MASFLSCCLPFGKTGELRRLTMRFDKINTGWFIVLVACISIIAGCQAFRHAPGYQKIPTKHLLFISRQGSLHLRWEARHLTIEFKGKISQNLLTANGHIDITGEGLQHFSMLDRLVVDIYFTDSAGNVLAKHKFYSTVKSPVDDMVPRTFKRNFELPKRTTHIAFSYDGTAREDGSKSLQKKGNAIEHGFQHSPFR
jgi:hypothetical protein